MSIDHDINCLNLAYERQRYDLSHSTYVVVLTAGKNPMVTVNFFSFEDTSLLSELQQGSMEERSYRCLVR